MFVHTVIMVIEPHMKQGRQHKLISTIFLATSVTKKLDHNKPDNYTESCMVNVTDGWRERNVWYPGRSVRYALKEVTIA